MNILDYKQQLNDIVYGRERIPVAKSLGEYKTIRLPHNNLGWNVARHESGTWVVVWPTGKKSGISQPMDLSCQYQLWKYLYADIDMNVYNWITIPDGKCATDMVKQVHGFINDKFFVLSSSDLEIPVIKVNGMNGRPDQFYYAQSNACLAWWGNRYGRLTITETVNKFDFVQMGDC